MARLSVNVDHVATVRQARGIREPDPLLAAGLAELAGADGIICHLREDRRHINDRDVRRLRETLQTKLNLEMAAVDEMIGIAREIVPDVATLVPERREELTTEGGLDVKAAPERYQKVVDGLHNKGIEVSFFIDPDPSQIDAAHEVGGDVVEIHTGHYAEARSEKEALSRFHLIESAVKHSADRDLKIAAGHGLNYSNIKRFSAIPMIEEYSIGHSIIARAIFVGIEMAVKEMISLVKNY
jgi:pyridoxine 5-phosphate synthase